MEHRRAAIHCTVFPEETTFLCLPVSFFELLSDLYGDHEVLTIERAQNALDLLISEVSIVALYLTSFKMGADQDCVSSGKPRESL